jgi:hypothetical protein
MRAGMSARSGTPKAKSRCSQPKLLAAQSLTYKPPKWFLRWQPGLAKHKLPIYIPTSNRRSIVPGRHAIRFYSHPFPCGTISSFSPISHSLRSVVPLGSFFGGCPPPPVTRLCHPTFVGRHRFPSAGPSQRVLPVFIRALGKNLSTLPSKPFGFSDGRHSNSKPLCRYSRSECHHSVRRPFAGLKDRNLRDGQSYTEKKFSRQSFRCFIFRKTICFSFREKNTEGFSRK